MFLSKHHTKHHVFIYFGYILQQFYGRYVYLS